MLASTGPATPFFRMHSMAMLWDGGAAVGMCTSVLGDKLRAFATAPRRLSREYGPDGIVLRLAVATGAASYH
jgi:hypothetical protein